MKKMLRPRSFGMLVLALILAATVYGFAAANTVPDTYAGDGSGDIYGYEVTNVAYDVEAGGDTDPSTIDEVTFTLDNSAGEVYVSFDGGTSWTSCSISGGTDVTCSISESVASAATLRVVAVQ